MVGNNHDSRPRQDRQYREGLMTGLFDRPGQSSWTGAVDGHHHCRTGIAGNESQTRPLIYQRNSRNPWGSGPSFSLNWV